MWNLMAETLLALIVVVLVYHHVGFPMLLRVLAARRRANATTHGPQPLPAGARLPTVTLIVPVHNEASVMVAKLANLAALDYPRDRLTIVLALDGCTDDTGAIVQASLPRLASRLDLHVVDDAENIGKVAVLNDQIAAATTDIVALSDASAAIDPSALLRAAAHFSDARVGVVCGGYKLQEAGSEGERAYWAYQTAIKADEAAVAAPMGAHGAFYLFRRDLWRPLPPDTINDDYVLPMRIVAAGYRSVYDSGIGVVELERTQCEQEFRRRVRIGAGNLQQVVRLAELGDPRRGLLALVFLSGKGLRPFIPFLALLALALLAFLAATEPGRLFKAVLASALPGAAAIALALRYRTVRMPKVLRCAAYLVEGHAASALGAVRYVVGARQVGWQPATSATTPWVFLKPQVTFGKRALDVLVAAATLVVAAPLMVPIAIAIKLDSPGPVFYRQRRVGRWTPVGTQMFELVKFRTMVQNAEARSGAVWATHDDPRITRVGQILRKTRLDELPQCFNVLRGDMSVIGPRPERPVFFTKFEAAVPFYVERTFGIRPGITGLAQVTLPYDATLDDVRLKCAFDHAYATQLAGLGPWLRTDLGILARTLKVMALGKGR